MLDVAEAGIDGLADLAGDTVSQIPDYALRWAGKTAETATKDIWFIGLEKQQFEFSIQCACHKTSLVSLLS